MALGRASWRSPYFDHRPAAPLYPVPHCGTGGRTCTWAVVRQTSVAASVGSDVRMNGATTELLVPAAPGLPRHLRTRCRSD